MILTDETVVQLVQAALDRNQPSEYRFIVAGAPIERHDDWWYVTVKPDRAGLYSWRHGNNLTAAEDDAATQAGIKVLLIPAILDD